MSTDAGANPMETVALPAWIDRLTDYVNPILIKETRQALKSRQFVITFFLMLVISWLVSMVGLSNYHFNIENQAVGRDFFHAYGVVLAAAVTVVIPFIAFRSLMTEMEYNTFDVLSVTTLTPRQVVWGKWLGALVQTFVYYSAITPFMAFTYLLKGIDVGTMIFVMVALLLYSMALSLLSLTISTLTQHRFWQMLITVFVVLGLMCAYGMAWGSMYALLFERLPFDELEFWVVVAIVLSYYVVYLGICITVAVTQLTFEADNRSTRVRLAFLTLFGLTFGWVVAMFLAPIYNPHLRVLIEGIPVVSFLLSLHAALFALFFVTEDDQLSRRIRRTIPRNSVLRLLSVPFYPGGARGLILVWLVVLSLGGWTVVTHEFAEIVYAGGGAVRSYYSGRWWTSWIGSILATCGYVLIYSGIGLLGARIGRALSSDFRPAHARVLLLVFVVLNCVLPLFSLLLGSSDLLWNRGFHNPQAFIWLINPFATVVKVAECETLSDASPALLVLAIVTVITTAVNIQPLTKGVLDILCDESDAPSGPQGTGNPTLPVA